MRIRIAHFNQLEARPRDIFDTVVARKVAWVTGIADYPADVAATAVSRGYQPTFVEDGQFWLAVRADLIANESFAPHMIDDMVFASFESTPPGLGELVVAAGDVQAQVLGETLGLPLVFYGATEQDEPGFGFYDRDARVEKLTTSDKSNNYYLEAVVTI